ncbi:diguanylate cyclase/phosphodiesterase (GGDEF & EAL domains) with PAS/PAC sensor(s) [hydrothermal vent metagenome]|uniref:histidine kinase n=1 Tax=hydrothermal vent metagenome TaxID=652676 RepID=A0A3B0YE42_9ZZZZ
MFKKNPVRSPIARILILYIILFSSCITFFLTAIQLYRDYGSELSLIKSELQQIEDIHLESITTALWASNKKLLQTNIEGILKIRDIQYVEIKDDKGILVSAGESITGNTIQRTYSINYMHRKKNINIGKLVIVVSLSGVYHRLTEKVWFILFFNALKTFIVAIFSYFLFYHMITRHLSKISEFAKKQAFSEPNQPLTLDRASRHQDELHIVVDSINDMRTQLHQQIIETRRQKQYLALTLNSIGDAVIVTDIDGNITRMNPVAEKMTGWTFSEAKMQPLSSIFSCINTTTRKPIRNPADNVILNGETIQLRNNTTLVSATSEEYQISDSASPIKNEKGEILGMVLVFNDVSQQYRLRQLAQSSEKKYHTLTTVAPVGIFHTDKQGKCLYVNKKWSELTDTSAKEAIEDGWSKKLHSEDKSRVFEQWDRCSKGNIPFKLEYRFQLKGMVRWVLGQATAEKDNEGNIIGYIATITDITDRKQAEKTLQINSQRLRDAQRIAHIGNWELNLINNKLTWSDEVYRIFELNPENFSNTYDALLRAIHPDDLEKVNSAFNTSLENKTPYNIEHRICTSDGTIKFVHQRCEIFYNKEGTPTRTIGTVQDISEQVAMENTIRRTQKMDSLGKLTGGIAHDYNNMLGVIMGYADILQTDLKDNKKLQKYAQNIYNAGERGANLTRKLLSFSRTKSSDTELVNLNTVLDNERDMLQKTLTARIKLVYDLSEQLWPTWLDRNDLENAIVNLSINAMHAMQGTGQLTVHTYNTYIDEKSTSLSRIKSGDYAVLSITDTGCGIDSTLKDKIFDPFYTTKGEQGTGLGLSQVYGFISRSQGDITVHSTKGNGAQFTLYFPRCYGSENHSLSPELALPTNSNTEKTILVVDDEPALLELTCQILSIQGYNTYNAENATDALEIMKNKKIDLMLSDVIMPGIDGYELAATVKQQFPEIKIQLTSGFNDDRHIDAENINLHENLLYKPLSSKKLFKRIDELLN